MWRWGFIVIGLVETLFIGSANFVLYKEIYLFVIENLLCIRIYCSLGEIVNRGI